MLDILAWIVSVGQLPTDPGALYKEWLQRVQLFETTLCSELLKRPQRHPWLTLSRGTQPYGKIVRKANTQKYPVF
jgi:hypothetical protein